MEWNIAQVVERVTKKQGAILTRVRFHDAFKGFFDQSRLLVHCTDPVWHRMHQHQRGSLKKKLTAASFFGHTTTLHTLIRIGGAVLAAAIAC